MTYAGAIGQTLALAGPDSRINLRLVDGVETDRLEIGRYDWESEEAGPFRHLGHGQTILQAVQLDDPERIETTTSESRIDLAGWLGDGEGLWFIQGKSRKHGVMRPFAWSARILPKTTREARLVAYEAKWRELLAHPEDDGWESAWLLITAVRAAGDAGALDQVQALGRIPDAAVALLFQTARGERSGALLLETEAPIWWPLVPWRSWALGINVAYQRLRARLKRAGIDDAENLAVLQMSRIAGEIILARPELMSHIGRAMGEVGLPPVARDANDQLLPLARPATALPKLAQEAARRFDRLPQGTSGLTPLRLQPPPATNEINAPLLHAPLVAAEVAAGLRPSLQPTEILQLIALRAVDQN